MTLSFSLNLNGQPTYFPEKILRSLWTHPLDGYMSSFICSKYCKVRDLQALKPKLHTIRADKSNRWKPGTIIHFVINNRSSNRLQFLPELPCISVQRIDIRHWHEGNEKRAFVIIDNEMIGEAIWTNCQLKNSSFTVDQLAINDGFENTNAFFDFFDKDFTGKIIHWTEKRY